MYIIHKTYFFLIKSENNDFEEFSYWWTPHNALKTYTPRTNTRDEKNREGRKNHPTVFFHNAFVLKFNPIKFKKNADDNISRVYGREDAHAILLSLESWNETGWTVGLWDKSYIF